MKSILIQGEKKMKKLTAILLLLAMVVATITACADPSKKSEGAMTYAEYVEAKLDDAVVVEAYVQATQSWWDGKITVYLADPDGAYFAYELACSEEDAEKLVPGTKIKITGFKTAYADEVEIAAGATFEFGDSVTYIAPAKDLTAKFGDDKALIEYQNQLASFKDVTISAIEYKNGEPGDDIYVTVTKGDATMNFCVEVYLTGEDSDVYKTVADLKEGDVVDIESFIYWYNGANPHITKISK